MLMLQSERGLPAGLGEISEALGIELLISADMADAQDKFLAAQPGILLLPALFASQPTLPLIQTCLKQAPECQAIMLVERDQMNEAAEAMRAGILDCLFLPFSAERLAKTLAGVLKRLGVKVSAASLERACSTTALPPDPEGAGRKQGGSTPAVPGHGDCIEGSSPATLRLKAEIEAAARTRLPLVLQGEAGSGKSHCAALIHAESGHTDAPFHKLDCAALSPETLPAGLGDPGERATYFLDELTDLSPRLQARLLRLISDEGLPRARLIAAISQDPLEAIASGALRRDLYYRLCVSQIRVPPLRARGADILLIAREKLRRFSLLEGARLEDFSPAAEKLLLACPWPGNIRQLQNVCRNLVLTHGPGGARVVEPHMLPEEVTASAPAPARTEGGEFPIHLFRGQSLAEIERRVIEAVIAEHDGSLTRAARILEVAPSTLYRKRAQWARDDSQKG